MNQEMPTFDVSSIPQDFSPLQQLGNGPDTEDSTMGMSVCTSPSRPNRC